MPAAFIRPQALRDGPVHASWPDLQPGDNLTTHVFRTLPSLRLALCGGAQLGAKDLWGLCRKCSISRHSCLPKDSLGGGPRSQQNLSSKWGFWERVAGRMHGPSMRGGVGVPGTVDARKGCQREPLGPGRSGPSTHSLLVPCVGHLGAGGGTHSPALPDFYPDPRNTEEPPREDGCWPPGVPWPLAHTVCLGTRPLIPEGWSPPTLPLSSRWLLTGDNRQHLLPTPAPGQLRPFPEPRQL